VKKTRTNEDKMAAAGLAGLPSEAWLCVLLHLQPADLCSVRATAPTLALLVDREAVWVWRAWCDYSARLRPAPDFSPRQFYQAVLHRYGRMFGLWQRTNLKFFGGLLRCGYSEAERAVVWDTLAPTADIGASLQDRRFLKAAVGRTGELGITSQDSLTAAATNIRVGLVYQQQQGEREDEEEEEKEENEKGKVGDGREVLEVVCHDLADYISSPGEWRQLLDEFRSVDTSQDTELALNRFVMLYHCRHLHRYTRLRLPDPGPDPTALLRPGVFQASYGPHGTEVVQLLQDRPGVMCGVRGLKLTGDPNVPFNQVSFRVTSDECLDLPAELQTSVKGVLKGMQDPQYNGQYREGGYLFEVPRDMRRRMAIDRKKCLGRWPAEAQVAAHMFQDPHFIPANFILFDEDEFAVMFLDIFCISLFRRVHNL